MSFGGNNPMNQSRLVRIYCGTILIILAITFVLQAGYLIDTTYDSIGDVVIDIVVFGAVWQVIILQINKIKKSKVQVFDVDRFTSKHIYLFSKTKTSPNTLT